MSDAAAFREVLARSGAVASSLAGLSAEAAAVRFQATTRFYLPSTGKAPVEVIPEADIWDYTVLSSQRPTSTVKGASPLVAITAIEDSSSSSHDIAFATFVSGPLRAQTITGTIQARVRSWESSDDANARSQFIAKVVSHDGATVRGILIPASTTSGTVNEWVIAADVTGARNARYPRLSASSTVTPVTCLDGDRVVFEFGVRAANTVTTPFTVGVEFGEAGDDLPANETNTAPGAPWVQFSTAVLLGSAPRSGNVESSFQALTSWSEANQFPFVAEFTIEFTDEFQVIQNSSIIESTFGGLIADAVGARGLPTISTAVDSSFAGLSATSTASRDFPDRSGAVASTFGALSASATAARTIPTRSAAIASSFNALTASITAARAYPDRAGVVASSFGKLSAASTASRIPAPLSASVGASIGRMDANAAAFRSAPGEVTSVIASSFKGLAASSVASRTIPTRTAVAAASFGALSSAVQAVRIPPLKTATASVSLGKLTASAAATREAPGIVSGTIAASFGKLSATAAASRTIPDRAASVASSFAKMSATVGAFRIPPPVAGDISAAFKILRSDANAIRLTPGARVGNIAASFQRMSVTAAATKASPDYSTSLIAAVYLTGIIDTDLSMTGVIEYDVFVSGVAE